MKVICIKDFFGIKKGTILNIKNKEFINDVIFNGLISKNDAEKYFMTLNDYRNYKLNIILDENNLY